MGKGQAALSGELKQVTRILKGTHGAEQLFLHITGATQTVKQVGQNLTRLFGSEIQEMKNTTQRLEEQNASLHAKFNDFESKLDRILEILEDFNQPATPGEPMGSPSLHRSLRRPQDQGHMLTRQWDLHHQCRGCRYRPIPLTFLR